MTTPKADIALLIDWYTCSFDLYQPKSEKQSSDTPKIRLKMDARKSNIGNVIDRSESDCNIRNIEIAAIDTKMWGYSFGERGNFIN